MSFVQSLRPTVSKPLISSPIRSSGQFRLRDLAMKLRYSIYPHVWPCDNNSGALLIALSHDSKLRHDLEEAIACRKRHQAYNVTINNLRLSRLWGEEWKILRTSQFGETTLQWKRQNLRTFVYVPRDYFLTEDSTLCWSTLSGCRCHCTMRNFFKTMKIHAIVDARQGKTHWSDGIIVAETLIRASLLENGDSTTLIMT